MKYARSGH
jgi:hypothetical protein